MSLLAKLFGKKQQTTEPENPDKKPLISDQKHQNPNHQPSVPSFQTPREYMPQAQQFMQNPLPNQIITVEQLKKERKNAFLLDVRQPEEVAGGKIPGAVPIPLAEVADNMDKLPTDKEIITVCAHGGRAVAAMLFLKERGYKHVRALMGGTAGWVEKGYDVE